MKKIIFSVAVLALIVSGCKKEEVSTATSLNSSNVKIKSIEISDTTFNGGYPAVYFNPTDGSIKPVGNDSDDQIDLVLKESDFKFWIEPEDPEFSTLQDDTLNIYGIKKIGSGDDVFLTAKKETKPNNLSQDIERDYLTNSTVFYIHMPKGDCVIQITNIDSEKSILNFKWRLI